MCEKEIKRYQTLNELAGQDGLVILGGSADREIPLCELKQAFALDDALYNRSVTDLSVQNAVQVYDACVEELKPESILLHIGEADRAFFTEDASAFDRKYRELIGHIRACAKDCRIAVISLQNPGEDAEIAEMNRHLKYIAESEQCEFGDISQRRVWNPRQTRDVVSFVYSTGFVRPLKNRRPLYDLVKILFCFAPSCAV